MIESCFLLYKCGRQLITKCRAVYELELTSTPTWPISLEPAMRRFHRESSLFMFLLLQHYVPCVKIFEAIQYVAFLFKNT